MRGGEKMLNRIALVGRLTFDPELHYVGEGIPLCTFSIAVKRPYSSPDGDRDVDFIKVIAWRKLAKNCADHLGKGRLVAVDGRLQIRDYENGDGEKRRVGEVVAQDVHFLDWPKDGDGGETKEEAV